MQPPDRRRYRSRLMAGSLVWLGLLAAGGATAAPAVSPPDPGIDALLQRYDGQVPGAAVLVLHDGQPVFQRGYGLAVVEDHTAVTARTNFRLASVSKQFTAAAVLLLAEDGALHLDDPLKRRLQQRRPRRLPDRPQRRRHRHRRHPHPRQTTSPARRRRPPRHRQR